MTFSIETIQEAIDQVYRLNLQGSSQEIIKALVVSNCAEIEGDKIRADYEARYLKNDDNAWLLAA